MSLFFESIKLLNGEIQLLEYHQNRMKNTVDKAFGIHKAFDLKSTLEIPCTQAQGQFKLKITYSKHIESVEIQPYEIKNHSKVLISENNDIDYSLKFSDRTLLDLPLIQNSGFDDVIFIKNKVLTDANYSNIVLFDGQNWFTPASHLLNGVKRQYLL